MYTTPSFPLHTARFIARTAQRLIRNKTGLRVSLLLDPVDQTFKTPHRMLEIISGALGMDYSCYCRKSRTREIVELRFIGALLLRKHFHNVTLSQIASFFGQDHSSVITGIERANDLIACKDSQFLKKYYAALNSVNLWLRRGA